MSTRLACCEHATAMSSLDQNLTIYDVTSVTASQVYKNELIFSLDHFVFWFFSIRKITLLFRLSLVHCLSNYIPQRAPLTKDNSICNHPPKQTKPKNIWPSIKSSRSGPVLLHRNSTDLISSYFMYTFLLVRYLLGWALTSSLTTDSHQEISPQRCCQISPHRQPEEWVSSFFASYLLLTSIRFLKPQNKQPHKIKNLTSKTPEQQQQQ